MRKRYKVLAFTLAAPFVATFLLNNPAQYVHWSDRAKNMTWMIGLPWGAPCETYHTEKNADGSTFAYTSTDDSPKCIRYDPPRQFDGIWWDEFEGEAYWDFARIVPMEDGKPDFGGAAWLQFDLAQMAGKDIDRNNGHEKPWHIRFIGRKTSVPGYHGHYGYFRHNVIVERIISLEPMPRPKGYKNSF